MTYERGKNPNSRNGFKKGHKLNIGNQHAKGLKHTDEWKKAMSERMKGNTNGFKKGEKSPRKGKKSSTPAWNKNLKLPDQTGEKHILWKGDEVSYRNLHRWVERHKGKPANCSHCNKVGEGRSMHWANKSQEYKRDLEDWIRLCPRCHKKYDSGVLHFID